MTSDSDPAAEYEETLHKAVGMRAALALALGLGEPQLRATV